MVGALGHRLWQAQWFRPEGAVRAFRCGARPACGRARPARGPPSRLHLTRPPGGPLLVVEVLSRARPGWTPVASVTFTPMRGGALLAARPGCVRHHDPHPCRRTLRRDRAHQRRRGDHRRAAGFPDVQRSRAAGGLRVVLQLVRRTVLIAPPARAGLTPASRGRLRRRRPGRGDRSAACRASISRGSSMGTHAAAAGPCAGPGAARRPEQRGLELAHVPRDRRRHPRVHRFPVGHPAPTLGAESPPRQPDGGLPPRRGPAAVAVVDGEQPPGLVPARRAVLDARRSAAPGGIARVGARGEEAVAVSANPTLRGEMARSLASISARAPPPREPRRGRATRPPTAASRRTGPWRSCASAPPPACGWLTAVRAATSCHTAAKRPWRTSIGVTARPLKLDSSSPPQPDSITRTPSAAPSAAPSAPDVGGLRVAVDVPQEVPVAGFVRADQPDREALLRHHVVEDRPPRPRTGARAPRSGPRSSRHQAAAGPASTRVGVAGHGGAVQAAGDVGADDAVGWRQPAYRSIDAFAQQLGAVFQGQRLVGAGQLVREPVLLRPH